VTHPRRLGSAFLGFSAAQSIGAMRIAAGGQTPPLAAEWVMCALLVAVYAVGGAHVLQSGRWSRALAVILSGGALVAFPLGTVLGVYGLWVAWRQMDGARAMTPMSNRRPHEMRGTPPQ
jgi:hypothetical protein